MVVPHVPNMGTTIIAINNHMMVMQVQVEKNTMEDVQLNGGSNVNIITI
jgi:hypothetical protein